MRKIDTQIVIDAEPARVWHILTDFARYPEWNPFIRKIQGELKPGSILIVEFKPPAGRAMTIRPEIIHVEPQKEFRWIGALWANLFFAGVHTFEIQQLAPAQTL